VTAAPAGAVLLQLARAGYGAALLAAPGRVISVVTGRPAAPGARATARVLGARHLLQAALTARSGVSARALRAGAAVDLTHAVSMAGLSVAAPRGRRCALADALAETALSAAGLAAARARQGQSPWFTPAAIR
jgi:hypothetical protein